MTTVFLCYPKYVKDKDLELEERLDMMMNYDAISKTENEYLDGSDIEMPSDIFEKIGTDEKSVNIWYLAEELKILGRCDVVLLHPKYERQRRCCIERTVALSYGINFVYLNDYKLEYYVKRYVDPRRAWKVRDILNHEGIWSIQYLLTYTDENLSELQKDTKGLGPTYIHEIVKLRDGARKELEEKSNEM